MSNSRRRTVAVHRHNHKVTLTVTFSYEQASTFTVGSAPVCRCYCHRRRCLSHLPLRSRSLHRCHHQPWGSAKVTQEVRYYFSLPQSSRSACSACCAGDASEVIRVSGVNGTSEARVRHEHGAYSGSIEPQHRCRRASRANMCSSLHCPQPSDSQACWAAHATRWMPRRVSIPSAYLPAMSTRLRRRGSAAAGSSQCQRHGLLSLTLVARKGGKPEPSFEATVLHRSF